MFGFTLNLLMDTKDIEVNERKSVPNLVWSSYDRLNLKKINKFEEFFVMDNDTVKWSGSIQSLHLYTCDFTENILDVRDDTIQSNNDLIYNKKDPSNEYSLATIISLKLDKSIFSQSNIHDNKKLVIELLKESEKVMESDPLEFFFSLGEEDLVLIALSNSVDRFMDLISRLRSLYFKTGGKSYSICKLTNSFLIQNCKKYNKKIKCDLAYANLNIALQEGINEFNFIREFGEKIDQKNLKPITVVGEYDIVIDLYPNSDSYNLFELYSENNDTNILNANSKFYKKFIKSSKTIWSVKTNDKRKFRKKHISLDRIYNSIHEKNNYTDVNILINNLLTKLNQKVINGLSNKHYAYYNVIYFLKEASLTLNSTSNSQWKYIVSEQIKTFITSYENFIETLENDEFPDKLDDYISELNEVISDMRNSFNHINRSNELFYHVPATSLHYSGSFNAILMAYYNFINKLLDLAFQKPHSENTKQAKIVFVVYFGMTSQIQQKTYLSNYLDPDETKLVGFELPYAALYDIKKYFISLTHEVYHLVAPYDRAYRNHTVETLWTNYFIKEEFLSVLREFLQINQYTDPNYKLNILVDEFFLENKVFYGCNLDYSDVLSLKKLNVSIYKQLIINDVDDTYKDPKEYFNILYFDFLNFCKSKIKDNSLFEELDNLKEIVNKFDNEDNYLISENEIITPFSTYVVDYNRLHNMDILISNITESICDNFMYQLSFSKEENPKEQFLKYLINFFNDNKVDFYNDENAIMRLCLFLNYNAFDLKNSTLDSNIISFFNDILKDYNGCYGYPNNVLINSLLCRDDFTNIIIDCCAESYKPITESIKQFKEKYILSLNESSKFTDYINIINELNLEFKIAEPRPCNVDNQLDKVKIESINNEIDKCTLETFYAKTLDDYLSIIKNIRENSNIELWYRGICNYDYSIIPSLFVNLPNEKIPYCYQLALMQECYSSTKKYYEVFAKNETPIAARQSLMQHYGVPTNLLDFSTDPLSSLFWALNPTAKNDQKTSCTAVIYIFNPYEYSKAMNYIKTHEKCDHYELLENIYPIHSHDSLDEEYIIRHTDDKNTLGLIESYSREVDDKKNYKKNMYKRLPVPIVIPQKNDRIMAQSGTFLAYNLFPLPNNDSDKIYDYLGLEKIHEKYIDLCKKNGHQAIYSKFLQRILIAPYCISTIKFTLNKIFNYSIDSIYPDLENLLKDVKKRTYGYHK